jgi:hypothetical protein
MANRLPKLPIYTMPRQRQADELYDLCPEWWDARRRRALSKQNLESFYLFFPKVHKP